MPTARTPISEVTPPPGRRSLTESDVKALTKQLQPLIEAARAAQVRDQRVRRAIDAADKVLTEAAAMPLHERPEADRRRIEGDLWTLAETLGKRPRHRSPFWAGIAGS
jgi:hypothetical protein